MMYHGDFKITGGFTIDLQPMDIATAHRYIEAQFQWNTQFSDDFDDSVNLARPQITITEVTESEE